MKTERVEDSLQFNTTIITLDRMVIECVQVNVIQNNEKYGKPEVVWFAEVNILDPEEHVCRMM